MQEGSTSAHYFVLAMNLLKLPDNFLSAVGAVVVDDDNLVVK